MNVCMLCEQADDRVVMLMGNPRHPGLDGCVAALKKALAGHQVVVADPPTAQELTAWYKSLAEARQWLVPKVLAFGEELDKATDQLEATRRSMLTIDAIIGNLVRQAQIVEQYAAMQHEPGGQRDG